MPNKNLAYTAIDLFSGCGGLSVGLEQAGFSVVAAIENDDKAAKCYTLNHPTTDVINNDIRNIGEKRLKKSLKEKKLDLLAGCPPCQGFSSVRRLNRKSSVYDDRNRLLMEYLRIVQQLKPKTIMLENVPGLRNYYLFKIFIGELKKLRYNVDYSVVNVAKYGVPQRRRRLVLVGSRIGPITIVPPTKTKKTVRQTIGEMESIETTTDPLHKIIARHSSKVKEMIKKIPHDGGSRTDLPEEYELECHKKDNVGFNDIYGRLRWDDVSSTITGGCLNPSKGRFLHPEQDRVITAREAALLQTFPRDYQFPTDLSKGAIALLIGNALPPEFSRIQSENIIQHLKSYNG